MANFCSNWVVFQGNVTGIKSKIEDMIKAEAESGFGQHLNTKEDRAMYDIYIQDESDDHLTISYETKWDQNSESIALACKEFGLNAEHGFGEPMLDYYGKAVYTQESMALELVPDEVFDRIEYDEEEDGYYLDGNTESMFECREELIESIYQFNI